MEHKTCPFCGAVHEFKPWLNIICPCGAKYYFMEKFWLNRQTGERRMNDGAGTVPVLRGN